MLILIFFKNQLSIGSLWSYSTPALISPKFCASVKCTTVANISSAIYPLKARTWKKLSNCLGIFNDRCGLLYQYFRHLTNRLVAILIPSWIWLRLLLHLERAGGRVAKMQENSPIFWRIPNQFGSYWNFLSDSERESEQKKQWKINRKKLFELIGIVKMILNRSGRIRNSPLSSWNISFQVPHRFATDTSECRIVAKLQESLRVNGNSLKHRRVA